MIVVRKNRSNFQSINEIGVNTNQEYSFFTGKNVPMVWAAVLRLMVFIRSIRISMRCICSLMHELPEKTAKYF